MSFQSASKERNIPVVSLQYCEYDKQRKVLKLASEYFGMPNNFFVESHHTGKIVEFVCVNSHDPLFDEDGWDGEYCIYRPVDPATKVDHMIIYHAY